MPRHPRPGSTGARYQSATQTTLLLFHLACYNKLQSRGSFLNGASDFSDAPRVFQLTPSISLPPYGAAALSFNEHLLFRPPQTASYHRWSGDFHQNVSTRENLWTLTTAKIECAAKHLFPPSLLLEPSTAALVATSTKRLPQRRSDNPNALRAFLSYSPLQAIHHHSGGGTSKTSTRNPPIIKMRCEAFSLYSLPKLPITVR